MEKGDLVLIRPSFEEQKQTSVRLAIMLKNVVSVQPRVGWGQYLDA